MIPDLAQAQQERGIRTTVHWSRFAVSQGITMSAILAYRSSLSTLDVPPGTVLHAHHPLAAIAAHAWMHRVGRIVPLILTVHGLPSPAEQPLLKRALHMADINVAVSRYLATTLLQMPGYPVHAVVHNGVDVQRRFRPRPLAPIGRGVGSHRCPGWNLRRDFPRRRGSF
ncbi:glycosyltransferase family 4 protein [Sulfobacillus harzensis]|uniref:Glycosyltransferase n=1 Tax=Sulfobacillus harzensis TaxID=2729629 RepID=A0A7Y0Q3L3_9FIRM|nr:glycosyltransferase family 4 protein [Sulfobacillus harzensis]NMP23672.1 glycosyltransferase [Sulfobacillus harzensis]